MEGSSATATKTKNVARKRVKHEQMRAKQAKQERCQRKQMEVAHKATVHMMGARAEEMAARRQKTTNKK